MILASWNVNSIKVRLPNVLKYLNDYKPDVLVLQETKVVDDAFPSDILGLLATTLCTVVKKHIMALLLLQKKSHHLTYLIPCI